MLGQGSAYNLSTDSYDKGCDVGDYLCPLVVHLCDMPIRNSFKGERVFTLAPGFRSFSRWLAKFIILDLRKGRESQWQDHVAEAAHCLVS